MTKAQLAVKQELEKLLHSDSEITDLTIATLSVVLQDYIRTIPHLLNKTEWATAHSILVELSFTGHHNTQHTELQAIDEQARVLTLVPVNEPIEDL